MAHPTAQKVFGKLLIGSHYNLTNGSGTCKYIRGHTVENLPYAVEKVRQNGAEIEPISDELVDLVREAAEHGDTRDDEVTVTWQVTAEVLQLLIDVHGKDDGEKRKMVDSRIGYIKAQYLPQRLH